MLSERSPKSTAVVRIAAALIVVAGFAVGAPAPAFAEESLSSIVRGGRLYDNWPVELKDRPPKTTHPAYPAQGYFADSPGTTWRCKECHGWDYRGSDGAYADGPHFTGIKGIRAMDGADPSDVVAVLKDPTHGYLELMGERDFRDLANFVSRGQVDMDGFIDPLSRLVMADRRKRESYFASICGHCHGNDGQRFRAMPTLGKLATTDPWLALHKILNGHPGENMPALRAFGIETLVEILAYAQTLPAEEIITSVARGGRLYDNWHVELDRRPPLTRHPAYPPAAAYAGDPKTTWRCKECHGWDYMGRDGAYADGPHATGIKGIRAMDGAHPTEIVAVLKNETHALGRWLEERDYEDLANFVSRGQIGMNRYIDPASKVARGSPYSREAHFNTICASCHGRKGTKISTMMPLGRVVTEDPWNALHKIMNGHPDEEMPALRVLLDMPVLVDILTYAQTLPTDRRGSMN